MHKIYTPLLSMMIVSIPHAAAIADGRITSMDRLPASVKSLYFATCPADSWIGNQRRVVGSSSKTLSDGTELFLMVCGDAASLVPFTAIAMHPSRSASEVRLAWTLSGKDHPGNFGNAHFGSAKDTVVSMSHSSASCNPGYIHRWDGVGLDLIAYDGHGCEE